MLNEISNVTLCETSHQVAWSFPQAQHGYSIRYGEISKMRINHWLTACWPTGVLTTNPTTPPRMINRTPNPFFKYCEWETKALKLGLCSPRRWKRGCLIKYRWKLINVWVKSGILTPLWCQDTVRCPKDVHDLSENPEIGYEEIGWAKDCVRISRATDKLMDRIQSSPI